MSSSSRDWQASPVPSLPSPSRMPAHAALLLRLSLALAVACLASLVSGLVWLLQDDDLDSPVTLDSRLALPSAPRLDLLPAACQAGGFDRRRLLQPHFGQTFKVKRVGVL